MVAVYQKPALQVLYKVGVKVVKMIYLHSCFVYGLLFLTHNVNIFILHYVFRSGACKQGNSCDAGGHSGGLEPASKLKEGMYVGV